MSASKLSNRSWSNDDRLVSLTRFDKNVSWCENFHIFTMRRLEWNFNSTNFWLVLSCQIHSQPQPGTNAPYAKRKPTKYESLQLISRFPFIVVIVVIIITVAINRYSHSSLCGFLLHCNGFRLVLCGHRSTERKGIWWSFRTPWGFCIIIKLVDGRCGAVSMAHICRCERWKWNQIWFGLRFTTRYSIILDFAYE